MFARLATCRPVGGKLICVWHQLVDFIRQRQLRPRQLQRCPHEPPESPGAVEAEQGGAATPFPIPRSSPTQQADGAQEAGKPEYLQNTEELESSNELRLYPISTFIEICS